MNAASSGPARRSRLAVRESERLHPRKVFGLHTLEIAPVIRSHSGEDNRKNYGGALVLR